jgi:hypothetical protein
MEQITLTAFVNTPAGADETGFIVVRNQHSVVLGESTVISFPNNWRKSSLNILRYLYFTTILNWSWSQCTRNEWNK